MTTKHTTGPWRWEFNRAHKTLHLVGGLPQYDLTIMDFDRWGMSGAVATLRDPAESGSLEMQPALLQASQTIARATGEQL